MLEKSLRLGAATVAAAALFASAAALAAKPHSGLYAWSSKDGSSVVDLNVGGKPRKIVYTVVSSAHCGDGSGVIIRKKIRIRRSGKFRFKGAGELYEASNRSKVTLRGRFVTPRKAKGTAHIAACDLTVKFTATYRGEG
jgi:hypothetical protein